MSNNLNLMTDVDYLNHIDSVDHDYDDYVDYVDFDEFNPIEVDDNSKKEKEWNKYFSTYFFEINTKHINEPKPVLKSIAHENIDIEIDVDELLKFCDEINFDENKLKIYKETWSTTYLANKETIKKSLKTVIDYCKTQPILHKKLQIITQILQTDDKSREGVITSFAQHGSVCNLEKEIVVNATYALLTNEIKAFAMKESLRGQIIDVLAILRELISEEMYMNRIKNNKSMYGKNEHYIVDYKNKIAKHIGIDTIHDDQPATINFDHTDDIKNFFQYYSTTRILAIMREKMNSRPHKITYDLLVEWFEQNSPLTDKYEFLGACFNEKGDFTDDAILYLLWKTGIIDKKSDKLKG